MIEVLDRDCYDERSELTTEIRTLQRYRYVGQSLGTHAFITETQTMVETSTNCDYVLDDPITYKVQDSETKTAGYFDTSEIEVGLGYNYTTHRFDIKTTESLENLGMTVFQGGNTISPNMTAIKRMTTIDNPDWTLYNRESIRYGGVFKDCLMSIEYSTEAEHCHRVRIHTSTDSTYDNFKVFGLRVHLPAVLTNGGK